MSNTNTIYNKNNTACQEQLLFFTILPVHDPAKENRVPPEAIIQNTFTGLYDYFWETLQVLDNKEDGMFIIPCDFHTENYKPALYKSGTKKGQIKYRQDGNPHIWRGESNVKDIYMLPIDIDGGMTIDEAREKWKDWRYILYPSFNHLKDGKTHKFRLLIEFERPIDNVNYRERQDAMFEFCGGEGIADKTALYRSHGFYMPCISKYNKDTFNIEFNEGKKLDAYAFKKREYKEYIPTETEITDDEKKQLLNDIRNTRIDSYHSWWQLIQAMKSAGYGINDVLYASCNNEKHRSQNTGIKDAEKCRNTFNQVETQNGGVGKIISIIKNYNRNYCLQRQTTYNKNDDFINALNTLGRKERIEKIVDKELEENPVLVEDVGIIDPFSRQYTSKLLQEVKPNLTLRNILYGPEGFGKSYMSYILVADGEKVLFCCQSNEQAVLQAEAMIKNGINCQLITSRAYKLKSIYGIEAIRDEPQHPWDCGEMNNIATMKAIQEKVRSEGWNVETNDKDNETVEERAEKIWKWCEPEFPNFDVHDVIMTTHDRFMAWSRMQNRKKMSIEQYSKDSLLYELKKAFTDTDRLIIPKDVFVFFDDPSFEQFEELKPYDEKFAEKKINGRYIEQKKIGPYNYFVKPDFMKIGWGCDNRIIFTTTELLTKHIIESKYNDVYVPESLMPKEKMIAGDLVVIATDIVRSKRDGFLSVIQKRLEKEGMPFELIGDGMGGRWNHVNVKGVNVLKDSDIVVELSIPRIEKTRKIMHEIGVMGEMELNSVAGVIIYDQFHQAMRNQGQRYEGNKCVVLVEPKYFEGLIQHSRYFINRVFKMNDIDCELNVSLRNKGKTLEERIMWYVKYLEDYVGDRQFFNDVQSMMATMPPMALPQILRRLKSAMNDACNPTRKKQIQMRISGYERIIALINGNTNVGGRPRKNKQKPSSKKV